jgi:hypothetical protein
MQHAAQAWGLTMLLQALQLSHPSSGAYVLECSSDANSWGVSQASRADQLRTSVCGSLLSVLLCWPLLLLLLL